MHLFYFLAFVAVLGASYAWPVAEEAVPATQLEDLADLAADQPHEAEETRPRRWIWGGIGGWGGSIGRWGGSGGWGGGWNQGWGGGHSGGWGGGWRVSYQPWSSGSSYWW